VQVLRLEGVQKFPRALVLLLMIGLLYDNGMCSIGFLIGEGDLLKGLSIPRFALHVLVTPLICVLSLLFARGAGVPAALSRQASWVVWVLAVFLMAVGFFQELAPMDFVARTRFGVLTYTHSKSMPPIAAIVANFFSIAAAFFIWRKTDWPVLLITSLSMLLLGGIPHKFFGLLPGNAGEIIFMAGFMLALKRLTPCHGREHA
jgi:hypothetical protein